MTEHYFSWLSRRFKEIPAVEKVRLEERVNREADKIKSKHSIMQIQLDLENGKQTELNDKRKKRAPRPKYMITKKADLIQNG